MSDKPCGFGSWARTCLGQLSRGGCILDAKIRREIQPRSDSRRPIARIPVVMAHQPARAAAGADSAIGTRVMPEPSHQSAALIKLGSALLTAAGIATDQAG